MALATSSQRKPGARSLTLEALERRLRASAPAAVPILVVRIPELERTAWRCGLRAARRLERQAASAFVAAAAAVLRGDDLLAHDRGSDIFAAAIAASPRDAGAIDARVVLMRLTEALQSATELAPLTGWTTFDPRTARLAGGDVVERALSCGAQERVRYAFFSALGHELRTPLSSIRGYLETLLDEEQVDSGTRRRFIRIAHDESLRMSRLIDGMFEISLLDLHATPPPAAGGSLTAALASAATACARVAAARDVVLTLAPADEAVVALPVDRLTMVLVNIVDNAIKHGRRGGCVRVAVARVEPDRVQIIVDDDGDGVAAGAHDRVFAFGERGATTAAGTGIGLAVVRVILERAGGCITLCSSPFGGARFVATVPLA